MKSELSNIIQVFESKIIRIPAFQRGYSWNEEHLTALWKDILNLLPSYDKKFHFTGVLVFEKIKRLTTEWNQEGISQSFIHTNQLSPYSLVDGQQRLTSLIILIYVLINNTEEFSNTLPLDKEKIFSNLIFKKEEGVNKYLFGYEIDTPSHYHLLKKIFEDSNITRVEPQTIYTLNLDNAKLFFIEKIKDYNTETRTRLLYIIIYQLKFSELILDKKQIDISMVFETLNFRGKPLSYLELLKNRILFLLSRNQHVRNVESKKSKVVKTWLTIYEYLGKTKKEWIKEDEFLSAFWVIYFNHDGRNRSEFKLKDCVSYLFEAIFPISNERNKFLETNDILRFLKKIELCIRAFYYLENPNTIQSKYFSDEPEEIHKIDTKFIIHYVRKLKEINSGWRPIRNIIAAYVVSDFYQRNSLIEILPKLERHNFLIYFLYGRRSNNNVVYLDRVTNNLMRSDWHLNFKNEIEKLTNNEIGNHKDIIKHIFSSRENNEAFFDWNGIIYLLKEYERWLRTNDYNKFVSLKSPRKTKILSQSNNRIFSSAFNYRTRIEFENSLGNIVLSEKDRSNYTYEELLRRFSEDGTLSEKEITNDMSYKAKNIFDRGVRILTFITKRWNITLPLNSDIEMKRLLFNNVNLEVKTK